MTAAIDALNERRDELIEQRRIAADKLAEAQAVVSDVGAAVEAADAGIAEIEAALKALDCHFEPEVTAKEAAANKE